MIVEDDALGREGLSMWLTACGCEVWQSEDGRAGIETARRVQPDLAVVDINLPDVDGCEVARLLRATGQPMCLVAVTARTGLTDRARAREAGFDEYLSKPIDLNQLRAILGEVGPVSPTGSAAPLTQ